MNDVHLDRSVVTGTELRAISRAAGFDPLPDNSAGAATATWHYQHGDYELAALARIVAEGRATNRFVDYAPNYGGPQRSVRFRARASLPMPGLRLTASGEFSVIVGDVVVDNREMHGDAVVQVVSLRAEDQVDVVVDAGAGAAALGVLDERRELDWETSSDDGITWHRSSTRPGGATPPHEVGEPEVELTLEPLGDGVFVAPAPVMGRLVVDADDVSLLAVGESLDEALDDPTFGESRTDVEPAGAGFRTRHRLGFRFVRVVGHGIRSVRVYAAARPTPRRGAFVTSDSELNEIWATAAYTLRLCMQTLLVDGIKRDRMPWIGDHALGVLTNAYAFADAAIVRDTLTALGRPRHGYINGIADYSLWWVISHGLYQRYFGDDEFLAREADHIHAFLQDLAKHASSDGVFRPSELPDGFEQAGPGSLFLDWGVTIRGDRDATAVQMLWFWALSSGASALGAAGHRGAKHWEILAAKVKATLLRRAWSMRDHCWREYLDVDGSSTAYPNFLATLAGLETPDTASDAVANAISAHATGTPFMRTFALLGIGRLGHQQEAVEEVRRLWGRMLTAGARTFWEEFDEIGSSPYEMYRRPYGKSLCHAWSAGPAAALPLLVLGVRPLENGWRRFEVSPALGELAWAATVVPTPHGDIVVHADAGLVSIEVPAGTVAVIDGREHVGPATASHPLVGEPKAPRRK